MPDINPMAHMLLSGMSIAQDEDDVDEAAKPIAKQSALSPGDRVIVASTDAQVDLDLAVGTVLDPTEYADQFPDYETRLAKYLLLRWRSVHDKLGDIGWFSRVRLFPLNEEQWEQMNSWVDETEKMPSSEDEAPAWLSELFSEYTQSLSEINEGMPTQVKCPNCEGTHVKFQSVHSHIIKGKAMVTNFEGKTLYGPQKAESDTVENDYRMWCDDCGAVGFLTDEEAAENYSGSRSFIKE